MEVQELIDKLKEYPPGMRVVTRGYESGWHDIKIFEEIELCLFVNKPACYGEHAALKDIIYPKRHKADETALSLDGENTL